MKITTTTEQEYASLGLILMNHRPIYYFLRWEMDFSSGLVTTTYSQIIAAMTPPPQKGQHKNEIEKRTIQSAIEALMRVGLIQKINSKDFLSFRLPLAQTKEVIVTTNERTRNVPGAYDERTMSVPPSIEKKETLTTTNETQNPMSVPGAYDERTMSVLGTHPLKRREEEEVREEQIKDENIYAETVEAKTPKPKKTKTPAPTVEKPEDITQEAWHILLTHRKNKKASMIPKIIERVVGKFRAASVATGKTIDEIIYFYVEKNWTGFEADWMIASTTTQTPTRKNKDVKPDYAAMFTDLPGDDSSPNIVFGPDANTRPIKDITPFPFLN